MPLYDFECTKCQHQQPNELVKMGTETTTCKRCGAPTKKLLSYRFSAVGLPNGHITFRGTTKN